MINHTPPAFCIALHGSSIGLRHPLFQKDCFDIYQPDATIAGGIAQVRRVMEMCRQKNRLFTPHTWTNGIGFYINWNMVLADPQNQLPLEYPLEEPSWVPQFREGIIDPIIPDKDGMLYPFTKPGLGFEIRKDLLRKYGKRFFYERPSMPK